MKSFCGAGFDGAGVVAPLVGAWIEIVSCLTALFLNSSLPLWERGLKFHNSIVTSRAQPVAPLVGAWIEMFALRVLLLAVLRRSPCGSVD